MAGAVVRQVDGAGAALAGSPSRLSRDERPALTRVGRRVPPVPVALPGLPVRLARQAPGPLGAGP